MAACVFTLPAKRTKKAFKFCRKTPPPTGRGLLDGGWNDLADDDPHTGRAAPFDAGIFLRFADQRG
jgi:hypothetical protein